MSQKVQCSIGANSLIIETGKLAKQADGAVTVQYGETVVLVTAVSSDSPLNGATRNGHKTIPVALLNMENYLTGKGLFDPALRPQIEAAFHQELDAATRFLNG